MVFEFSAFEPSAEPSFDKPDGPFRRIYELPNGEALYFPRQQQLHLEFGARVKVLSDLLTGLTRIHVREPESEQIWPATHLLFTLPLIEQLKRMGLFNLHASGVARGGRSVLMPGVSGSGKSTLSLALLQAGMDYLADDMIFLRRSSDGIRALAFPEDIDVTADSLALLGHLDGVRDSPPAHGAPKFSIAVDRCFAARIAWDTQPAALVFPHVSGAATSELQRLNSSESFLELVHSVLLTDSAACQRQIRVLGELAETTPSYRLAMGRDPDTLRSLIDKVLVA